jgi:fermentation-respiration switch protein FrsA (DUF1100 family)
MAFLIRGPRARLCFRERGFAASWTLSTRKARQHDKADMSLLLGTVTALAGIYVLAAVALAAVQRKLQYFPDPKLTLLAQSGLNGGEDLRVRTADGETLVAWHFPPRNGRPLILYFHGNGGALIDRVPRFRLFLDRGYGLLAVSYRGYGGSTGSPTQAGLIRDSEAAYREARALGYNIHRIILMGASLGTGVAIALAATHAASAIVLEAPYLSALDVARTLYPIFPVNWLMLDRFRSDLAIRNVHVPVLMVHGEKDDVIPMNSARSLFALANEPKTFVSVSGGDHLVLDLPDVFPRVCEWIDAQASTTHP